MIYEVENINWVYNDGREGIIGEIETKKKAAVYSDLVEVRVMTYDNSCPLLELCYRGGT